MTYHGLGRSVNELEKDLVSSGHINIPTPVCKTFVLSLKKQLQTILGPIFQANYMGFIQECEKRSLIPRRRTKAQDTELQEWFLQSMQAGGTQRLFDNNAYLKEKTLYLINCWRSNNLDFLNRLQQDQDTIKQKLLANSPDTLLQTFEIKALQLDVSDPHNGFQTARIIELTSGQKLVYKPRPLAPEKGFYNLVAHLNSSNAFQSELYAPWVIDKSGYGWMEFIQPLSKIKDDFDHNRYAEQFGALCALWYVVGGTDLHSENILFSNKGVAIVDCETVFDADFSYVALPNANFVQQRVEPDAYRHTILSTSALSLLTSDLGIEKETIYQTGGVAEIKNLFKKRVATDDTRDSSHWSLSPITNAHISWDMFAEKICQSIETTLSYFRLQKPDQTIAMIRKYFANDTSTRTVLRQTASYGAILRNLSTRYKLLNNADEAKRYISAQLNKAPDLSAAFLESGVFRYSEITQLADFNIPYFTRRLGQNEISTTGVEYSFDRDVDFSSLAYRLTWLQDDSFIQNEVTLAKMALSPYAMLSKYVCASPEKKKVKEYYKYGTSIYGLFSHMPDSSKSILSDIADQLVKDAEQANSVEHAFSIISFDEFPDAHQPMTLSYSLFEGLSGKILFLGLYAHITGRPDLIQFVREKSAYFMMLGNNETSVKEHSKKGVITGYQSLMYCLGHLQRIGVLNIDFLATHLTSLQPQSHLKQSHDLIRGIPGNSLVASNLADMLPPSTMPAWTNQLKTAMRALISDWDTREDEQRVGLAHGALGSCLAASRLYRHDPKATELKDLAFSLITLESELAKRISQSEEFSKSTKGWCYGDAGRALACYSVGMSFGRPDLVDKALALTALQHKDLCFRNHTLCCGSLGFIAAHLTVHSHLPEYQSSAYRLEKFHEFYKHPVELLEKGHRQDPGMMPSGLFYGTAGLGLVLLYAMHPDIVPAVWTLE